MIQELKVTKVSSIIIKITDCSVTCVCQYPFFCLQIFGGWNRRYKHKSDVLGCDMTFTVFYPPACESSPVPVLLLGSINAESLLPLLIWTLDLSFIALTDELAFAMSRQQLCNC